MSQKLLITIFFILFAVSVTFLFWQSERELNPDRNKNWWTLAFAVPQKPDDLSFVVENHSDRNNFQYKVIANKETLAEGMFDVQRGETKTISPTLTAVSDIRTSIVVTDGKEQKEIYR
jgi:hypothetical protein